MFPLIGLRPIRRLLVLVCLLVVADPAGQALAQQKPVPYPANDELDRMNESIGALTRKVWPSVVQILVTGYVRYDGKPAEATIAVFEMTRDVDVVET